MQDIELLVGHLVNRVDLDDNNQFIQFHTDKGIFAFFTNADCCSESWINHVSGLQSLINNLIIKIDYVEMSELIEGQLGHSGRQQVDIIYSFKFFTKDGVCEFEMRNSSNGYYGGYLQRTFTREAQMLYEDF
jgi:hypothetical protein